MSRLQDNFFIRSINGVSRTVFSRQGNAVMDKRGILNGLGNGLVKGNSQPKIDIPVLSGIGKDPKDDTKPDPPKPESPPEPTVTSVSSTPTSSVNEPSKAPDSAANNAQIGPTVADSQAPSSTKVQIETEATTPAIASTSMSSDNKSTPDASNKEVPPSSVSNAATQPSPEPAPLGAVVASSSTTSNHNILPATHDQASNPTLTHTTPTVTNAHAFPGHETSSSKLIGNHPGSTDAANPFIGATETSSHGSSRISSGAIAGLTTGSVVIVCLVAFLVWFFKKRSAENRGERLNSPVTDTFGGSTTGGRSFPAIFRNQFKKWFAGRDAEGAVPDMTKGDTNYANKNDASVQNVPNMSEKHEISGYYPSPTARNIGFGFGAGHSNNPFSDRNAIGLPPQLPSLPPAMLFSTSFGEMGKNALPGKNNTIGAEVLPPPPVAPHYRGRSLNALPRTSHGSTDVPVSRAHSVHRESLRSADAFSGKRDKFHSNPFDLEIESGLISSQSLVPSNPGLSMASSTASQSSRCTSGTSLGDWNIVRQSWAKESATPVPVVKWDSSVGEAIQNPSEQSKFVYGQAM